MTTENLEQRASVADIVRSVGMSDRPEYYSGRGATLTDLQDRHLEGIYQKIESAHGPDAAENYALMVADIPKLTATDFLLTLYALESHRWIWDKKLLGNEKGIYVTGEAVGFATLVGGMFGDLDRDETMGIRREFLRRHGLSHDSPVRKVIDKQGRVVHLEAPPDRFNS